MSVDPTTARRRCVDCNVGIPSGYVRCRDCFNGPMTQVTVTKDVLRIASHGDLDPTCHMCHAASRASVHDLLRQLEGVVAKSWEEEATTIKWFIDTGGPEALAAHGWRFEAYQDDARPKYAMAYAEKIDVKPVATPETLFLQSYEVTGHRDDWVANWELRGHWHAEHVKLKSDRRNDGIKLLISMGCSRGRIKDVGAVTRGVRKHSPMTEDEIAAVFK